MLRKRERFERTDVPTKGPYTNIIALAVLAVLAVVMVLGFSTLWRRVQRESNVASRPLASAIADQPSYAVLDGTTPSEDSQTRYLLLGCDSIKRDGCQLTSVRIMVCNWTQGTITMANIPTTVRVSYNDEAVVLGDLCIQSGPDACVDPLSSACDVPFDHVVVTSAPDALDQLAAASGTSASDFSRGGVALLDTLRTDMDGDALAGLASTLGGYGVANIASFDAATVSETSKAEDGTVTETGFAVVDRVPLQQGLGVAY